ncbi:EF-hand calcium-binding domain-containing protein 11 isoform X1 [Pongo pygmaeus]|uniref:EF-hand calcium-binding domain-containing protein 11 isoform X1 n=1 Tax=Pongo pygmaeus TaxID=9600 RepID=UPI0023E82545|nr:EF-hand calcium-binding domain-containing protein 11 isoform X3 [Pongo abelii]
MFFSEARARSRTWEASPSEHRKWVEVFKACDEDHKGYLSREDFKTAVVMLFGYKPSKIEVDSVMSSINPNTSGILLEGFLNTVRKKKEAQRYQNEVRHIFTAFDTYYRGFLTLEDFKKAFRQVAPKLPERTVLEVFSQSLILPAAHLLCHSDLSVGAETFLLQNNSVCNEKQYLLAFKMIALNLNFLCTLREMTRPACIYVMRTKSQKT